MARMTPFPRADRGFQNSAIAGFSKASDINMGRREQIQRAWETYLQTKLQKEQLELQKKQLKQNQTMGYLNTGLNAASLALGPGSIGAGMVANRMAQPYQDKLLELLAKGGESTGQSLLRPRNPISSLGELGIDFNLINPMDGRF